MTIPIWVLPVLLFGMMLVYAYGFGDYMGKVLSRVSAGHRRPLYRKWGMEADIFGPQSRLWFIVWGVVNTIGLAFTFIFALFSTILVTDNAGMEPAKFGITAGQLEFTSLFAGAALYLGLGVDLIRTDHIATKVRRLTALRPIYHRVFSVSEILAMYESLSPAPDIFWEEYTNLPEHEVNLITNQRYRERAVPYGRRQVHFTNRILAGVGILSVALTIIIIILTAMALSAEGSAREAVNASYLLELRPQ